MSKASMILVQKKKYYSLISAAAMCVLLAGCGLFSEEEKPKLSGERISVLQLEKKLEADASLKHEIRLPAPISNADWPQAGGYPDHVMGHAALPAEIKQAWRVSVGQGAGSRGFLLAAPVAFENDIAVMDAEARVTVLDATTGKKRWDTALRPRFERSIAGGGGIAHTGAQIIASTGYGELVALDAKNGERQWTVSLAVPVRSAPTIARGIIYIVTIENEIIAFNSADGSEVWRQGGVAEMTSLVGSASIAVSGTLLVAPLSSGELVALHSQTGRSLWFDSLAGVNRFDAVSSLADIVGHPVIDRNVVIAVSNSGLMAAIEGRSGRRIWEREIASVQTPAVVGEYIFVITNNAQLVALKREDGAVLWVSQLEQFERAKDRRGVITWTSPVLAGNRIWLANSKRQLLQLSPYTGEILAEMRLPAQTSIAPIVVKDTLYILDDTARLTAYR